MDTVSAFVPFSLNVGGRLQEICEPWVMGIVNVTPDSFFPLSRVEDEAAVARRVRQVVDEGARIIDVGACSTRPGSQSVSLEEEVARLRRFLPVVLREAGDMIVSVDTFRADVARMCVEEYGVHIINDVSGGEGDDGMEQTVARLGVPYVLTRRMSPRSSVRETDGSPAVAHALVWLSRRIRSLREKGVADILIDPGLGFDTTRAEDFALLAALPDFALLGQPLLVGLSRKRIVTETLGISSTEALEGTTALHTVALLAGTHILRVHDVRPACQAVALVTALRRQQAFIVNPA